jgi:hypothetical protein
MTRLTKESVFFSFLFLHTFLIYRHNSPRRAQLRLITHRHQVHESTKSWCDNPTFIWVTLLSVAPTTTMLALALRPGSLIATESQLVCVCVYLSICVCVCVSQHFSFQDVYIELIISWTWLPPWPICAILSTRRWYLGTARRSQELPFYFFFLKVAYAISTPPFGGPGKE